VEVGVIPKLLRPLISLHDRIKLYIDHLYTLQTLKSVFIVSPNSEKNTYFLLFFYTDGCSNIKKKTDLDGKIRQATHEYTCEQCTKILATLSFV